MVQLFNPKTGVSCLVLLVTLAMSIEPVEAFSECDIEPCLNGGTCSEVESSWVCSCPVGFLGPSCAITAAEEEEITLGFTGSGGGSGSGIGWNRYSPGRSGYGQTFRPTRNGKLKNISFEVAVTQEAVDEEENLIVEFWNVDQFQIPVGAPLASRTVLASSFTTFFNEVKSVDFSADNIILSTSKSYGFTLSVLNPADTSGYGMYSMSYDNDQAKYLAGSMLRASGGGDWRRSSDDLNRFEVTAITPLFDSGFEATVAECDWSFIDARYFQQGESTPSLFIDENSLVWLRFENTAPNHQISARNDDESVDLKMEVWYPDEDMAGCLPANYTHDDVGAGLNLSEVHDTSLEGVDPIPNGDVFIRIMNLTGSTANFTVSDSIDEP